MDALTIIGEQKIREALERGELDDLPLNGQPLQLEDLSGVPDELRLGYLVLRSAGFVPAELAARKELMTLEELLDACEDPIERGSLRRKLNAAYLRWEMLARDRGDGGAAAVRTEYERRIQRRFRVDR